MRLALKKMEFILIIAAIGIILYTLPLLIGLLGIILSAGAWLLGAGLIVAIVAFGIKFIADNAEVFAVRAAALSFFRLVYTLRGRFFMAG